MSVAPASVERALRDRFGDAVLHGVPAQYLADATEARGLQGNADAVVLPRSAEQVSAVVNTIPDAIVTFGDDGAIRSFNAGAEQMFGYGSAEVLGRNIAELLPGESSGGGAAAGGAADGGL